MKLNIRERLKSYKRVLQISKKPVWDDLKDTARICALGMILIGIIGFVLYLLAILGGL